MAKKAGSYLKNLFMKKVRPAYICLRLRREQTLRNNKNKKEHKTILHVSQ